MGSYNAKLTCVVKSAYAFNQLLKMNQSINVVVEESDEEVPGKEPGTANVPCPGSWRIERVDGEVDTEREDLPIHQDPTRSLDERIILALGMLDPEDDDDWNAAGEPRVDVVSVLIKDKVSRQEIELAQPGFDRVVALG